MRAERRTNGHGAYPSAGLQADGAAADTNHA
jgi:hypothetical protein